jgi:hypothetical protein
MSQSKASLRRALRSALTHKAAADILIDSVKNAQTKINAALDKLDADSEVALDTNYAATCAIAAPLNADAAIAEQDRSSLRRIMRSKLKSKKAADTLVDAIAALHSKFNSMLAKLDAEAGTLNDVNYVSTLAVSVLAPNAPTAAPTANKASLRRKMEVAMSHRKLANSLLDGVVAAENALNAALAKLDAGTINGQMASLKVSVIDPESN